MKLMWHTDTALCVTAISPQMRIILKLDEWTQAVTLEHIAGPDSPNDFGIIAHEWALLGERVTFEMQVGGVVYVMEVEPLHAPDGSIAGTSGTMQRKVDKVAEGRRSSIAAHAETLGCNGSWYYDARSGEYEWSDGLYELLGVDVWMPFSRDVRMYDLKEESNAISLAVEHARLTHEPYSLDHRIVRTDGAIRHVQEKAAFYFDERGQLTHVIGTMSDITDRKRSESRLAYLAYHDPLSDLPNRTLLEERFTTALERARFHNSYCAILFIDIDGFKAVNDNLGHTCGDDLLRAIASRLRSHVRTGDTLARLGGDEFVILLDSFAKNGDAQKVAAAVLEIFKDPFTLGQRRITVSASIGVAVAPPAGTTLQAILDASDRAMYQAKREGGNRIYAADSAPVLREMVG
jgi:diguanylate cyclase (GGDEF)-like protein/PAS domain S-box-containing protein